MALASKVLPYKRSFLLFFFLFLAGGAVFGQAPDSINYQAVARDDQGKVLSNVSVDVRMSILSGPSAGTLVYEEEHTGVSTNQFGLFTLFIGGGTQTGGSAPAFDSIAWGNGEYHIEVEVNAGSGYESLGSRKFVSVPYALYAEQAGSGGGGAGSLQSAYEGGNTITLDSSNGPVLFEEGTQTLLHADDSTVSMGLTTPVPNTRLDVRYISPGTKYGPGALTVASPFPLPQGTFSSQSRFGSINTGLFGVGVGSKIAVGVTGYSVHNSQTASLTNQDSIYGVTGVAVDQYGATGVGVSGVAQANGPASDRSVGVYGRISGDTVYTNDPQLAGGVFEAAVFHASSATDVVDSAYGVVGLGSWGADHNVGVFGSGRALDDSTYGVIGVGGRGDRNIGVLGIGAPQGSQGIAAIFTRGRTIVTDTLQIETGSPSAGDVLTAIGPSGRAHWTSGGGGGAVSLQDAYNNGDTIALNSGGSLRFTNNGNSHDYFYASDGNSALAVGHQQPNGTAGGSPVALHVAKAGANPGQLLITAGDNTNTYDGVVAFSENLGSTSSGAEIRYDAGYNKLIMGREVGGSAPMLAVQGGPGSTHGVLIGGSYSTGLTNPPQNGLLVEDTVGIGTTTPAHRHHIEGRTFSREGMLVHDTAEYRYTLPKKRTLGFGGHEFRPSTNNATANQNYGVASAGCYYSTTLTTSGEVAAPVDLPDGAVVDSVVYHLYDNVSTDSLGVRLERIPYGATSAPSTVTGTEVVSNDGGGQTMYGIPANPLVIDNKNYVYRLRGLFSTGQGTSLRLVNVEIRYSVKKAD